MIFYFLSLFGNCKMAVSAISNNTVNGEGMFISGMKKKH